MKGAFVFENLLGRISGTRVLGHILVRGDGTDASVVVSSALRSLPRSHWHWLYLQHLAETVASIAEDHRASGFVAGALVYAQTVCTQSSWSAAFAPEIARAMRRAWFEPAERTPHRTSSEETPEADAAGGAVGTIEIVQDDGALPKVRIARPRVPERLQRLNLVLLRHVLGSATDSLEEFQICRKIEMLARYYRATKVRRSRSAVRNAPVFAVLHADVARLPSAEAPADPPAAPPDASPRRRRRARRALTALKPGMPLAACMVLALAGASWLLLLFGASGPGRLRAPGGVATGSSTLMPAEVVYAALPAVGERPRMRASPWTPARRAGAAAFGATHVPARPRRTGPKRGGGRFQVRSQPLARVVATQRVRVLAEHGIRSYVRSLPGQLAEIDYGLFDSKQHAESRALHLRRQGYTAVVVPSDQVDSRQAAGGGAPHDDGP